MEHDVYDIDDPKDFPPKKGNGFLSRKFILAMFTIGLSSWLLKTQSISIEAWTSVVGTAVLGYMAGNVGTEAVTKWINK